MSPRIPDIESLHYPLTSPGVLDLDQLLALLPILMGADGQKRIVMDITAYGKLSLTLVAPFIDQVEAAFEERVVGWRGSSGEGEDGGAEWRGGAAALALRIGLGWVRWDRGENEVVRIGKLPSVVGRRTDEVTADADRVFLGVEMNAREPEFAVG